MSERRNIEHVLWEVSLGGRGPSWLWGWSYGHLDKSGFLPVLDLAHFQVSLDEGKLEPAGVGTDQAVWGISTEKTQSTEKLIRSSGIRFIQSTTSFSLPPELPWLRFTEVVWATNENKIWSLPSRIWQSYQGSKTHSQQRKWSASTCPVLMWETDEQVKGGGGLGRVAEAAGWQA